MCRLSFRVVSCCVVFLRRSRGAREEGYTEGACGWPGSKNENAEQEMCVQRLLTLKDRIVNGRDSERVQREKRERKAYLR